MNKCYNFKYASAGTDTSENKDHICLSIVTKPQTYKEETALAFNLYDEQAKIIISIFDELAKENQQLKEKFESVSKGLKTALQDVSETTHKLNQIDEVIEEAINHIKTKINNSFNYDYGFDTSNPSDRLFTETVIELQLVLEILNKYKGDKDGTRRN